MTRPRMLSVLFAMCCGCQATASSKDPGDGGQAEVDASITSDASNACAAAESCDGVVDDDCDGKVDEGCGRCPLLARSCPGGCCAVDRWEVDQADTLGADLAVAADGTIFFAYSTPSGGPWTATLAIYDPLPGTWRKLPLGLGSYRNRVRIDGLGRIHVASAGRNGEIQYRRSEDHGQTFSTPTTVGILDSGSTFDLEVDSTGAPHVAWSGDKAGSSFSDLRYAHLEGTTWTTTIVDPDTRGSNYPDLALGFADRPHIVYEAYDAPDVGGTSKRYAFHNGNRWITETIDDPTNVQTYSADHYFAAHSLKIAADDSRELLFERSEGGTATLLLARRGPADTDGWQVSPITGAPAVTTSVMFSDAHGARGAVSDGLRLHREQSGTTWSTDPIGMLGRNAGVARRGRYLYIGFYAGTGSWGKPTLTVIDLGP